MTPDDIVGIERKGVVVEKIFLLFLFFAPLLILFFGLSCCSRRQPFVHFSSLQLKTELLNFSSQTSIFFLGRVCFIQSVFQFLRPARTRIFFVLFSHVVDVFSCRLLSLTNFGISVPERLHLRVERYYFIETMFCRHVNKYLSFSIS